MKRTSRPPRHESMLRAALAISEQATCARRAVGCILTNSRHHIIGTGYNGVSAGQPHCIDHPCPGARMPSGSGLDVCEAVHAEENALMQCRDVWDIQTCYTTTQPCISCVKKLLNTSCLHILFLETYVQPKARNLWLQSSPLRTWRQVFLDPKPNRGFCYACGGVIKADDSVWATVKDDQVDVLYHWGCYKAMSKAPANKADDASA